MTAPWVALWVALWACSRDQQAEVPWPAPPDPRYSRDDLPQPGADHPDARHPVKAGRWYAETPSAVDKRVDGLLAATGASPEGTPYALLTPHAGIAHSGPTAAEVWARVLLPQTVIVLAPNHWDQGERLAIWPGGPWLVPGHALATDAELTTRAQHWMPALVPDREAFAHHEVEMQLPFLQWARPDVQLVTMAFRDDETSEFAHVTREEIDALGQGLAGLLRELDEEGREVTLLFTVDLVHYQPLAVSDEHDPRVLELIAAYDVDGLVDYVTRHEVTTCGEVPAAIAMTALATLGRPPLSWTTRGTNHHRTRDDDRVVGYPGGILWP